jgi:hypothetical protein
MVFLLMTLKTSRKEGLSHGDLYSFSKNRICQFCCTQPDYRRNEAGVEGFSSFFQALFIGGFQRLIGKFSMFLMFIGLISLVISLVSYTS